MHNSAPSWSHPPRSPESLCLPISRCPRSHPTRWASIPGGGREVNRTLVLLALLHLLEEQKWA